MFSKKLLKCKRNEMIFTHPGVRIGLQAGSSCWVNFESVIKYIRTLEYYFTVNCKAIKNLLWTKFIKTFLHRHKGTAKNQKLAAETLELRELRKKEERLNNNFKKWVIIL